ncbi:hydroxyproline dehydrogenase-like [Lonchura striata]
MGGSMGQDGSMGQGESLEARVGRVRAQLRQGRALAALGWGELLRALLVLGLCAHPRLQRDPEALLRRSRRVLGRCVWRSLLSVSLWAHFAAAPNPAAVAALGRRLRARGGEGPRGQRYRDRKLPGNYRETTGKWEMGNGKWEMGTGRRLRARGVRPMLAVPMEGEGPRGQREPWRDGNCEAALRCVALAAAAGPEPAMQLKLTALLSPRLCEKISLRLAEPEGAGLSPEEVAAMLDGQAPALPWLSPEENEALGRGLGRLQRVAQAAVAQGVQVLVDAELAHLNPALTCLTCGLMWRHNRAGPRPWVWHTWQAYLRATEPLLRAHLAQVRGAGLRCGVKLVRGAYLELEQRRARGGPAPTWDSAEETSASYERCLRLLLAELARPGSRLSLMVATHNEESALAALRGLSRVPPGSVCFGQLRGMGEHLSLALAAGGFPVYQSVPLGAPEVTIPYLARRAAENRGALRGARRQRQLLAAELRRRLWPWG